MSSSSSKIKPIESLEQLLTWKSHEHGIESHVSRVPFTAPRREPTTRCLLVHDMKGGYTEDDVCINGSTNAHAFHAGDAWKFVTEFCYFAHELVCVPPVCWTESAHKHGARSLATFITEWQAGFDVCEKLFGSFETSMLAAHQLAQIAEYYGFDGYLVNIENPVRNVDNLKAFLGLLKGSLPASSLVVWYDSVTCTGELQYQNCLNALNAPFLELCDAIFLNYHWNERAVRLSVENKPSDDKIVYFGVDVHGRKTFGGGGMRSHVAARAVCNVESLGIFAPAWTHENHETPVATQFWKQFEDCLPIAPFHDLPFYSNFCCGAGSTRFLLGKCVSSDDFCDLRLQTAQPSWLADASIDKTLNAADAHAEYDSRAAFCGSRSLALRAQCTDDTQVSALAVKLFATHFLSTSNYFCVSFAVKLAADNVAALILRVENGPPIALCGAQVSAGVVGNALGEKVAVLRPFRSSSFVNGWESFAFNVEDVDSDNAIARVDFLCFSMMGDSLECNVGHVSIHERGFVSSENARTAVCFVDERERITSSRTDNSVKCLNVLGQIYGL